MACDASFLKHYHTPVIHFGTLHFKNEETLYYSAGPISRYSHFHMPSRNHSMYSTIFFWTTLGILLKFALFHFDDYDDYLEHFQLLTSI